MANEITVTLGLAFAKGGSAARIDPIPFQVTLTGTRFHHGRQSIGTTEEAMVLGEVVGGGWCLLRNLDATNFVKVKPGAGKDPLARMKAGEAALFRLDATSAATPYLQADTAACEVEVLVLPD